ncbi:phosphate ABC transporter permease PstA [Oculatella sp. LEGE 06141]|uniref:phosphate ABC transporter permease PstA n=1 Tax=Oculatella sp. LEGE 06141 TaxID=1828648 RepID=UPI00187E06C5|nr:phosphate ABC transporter permease PstA [Oculatella sp. LEGE 06141]MBE9182229.1 phosphate ABC transporter permease PstA [Oculatella sp. LEGE 06141]
MTAHEPSLLGNNLPDPQEKRFDLNLSGRYRLDKIFAIATLIATISGVVVLLLLLFDILSDGLQFLNWNFLSSYPSRSPERAGILSPLVGTVWLLVLTALITFPLGVGAGIFLEEFSSPDSWYAKLVEININNLAAVPSIIYGLLGLQVFVRILVGITGGRSVLAGALTLSLLVLPIVIVSTREALRAVSSSLRQGGLALGATRWQVVREHVFPLALPGILTGMILALSRAIGETAPLITLGALTFIAFLPPLSPAGLQSSFTALPIQIYNWVSRPQVDFHNLAASGIIVLMVVLLLMNTTAILLRNRFQKTRI